MDDSTSVVVALCCGRWAHIVQDGQIKNLLYSPPVTIEADQPNWRCCLDSTLNTSFGYELQQKSYQCPEHPSNASYYFKKRGTSSFHELEVDKWRDKRVSFVGGSVTRHMHEQLLFEGVPVSWSKYVGGHFLFKRNNTNGACCKYDASHELDLRELDPSVQAALKSSDILVVNVASWWSSNTIGYVTDVTGQRLRVSTRAND